MTTLNTVLVVATTEVGVILRTAGRDTGRLTIADEDLPGDYDQLMSISGPCGPQTDPAEVAGQLLASLPTYTAPDGLRMIGEIAYNDATLFVYRMTAVRESDGEAAGLVEIPKAEIDETLLATYDLLVLLTLLGGLVPS